MTGMIVLLVVATVLLMFPRNDHDNGANGGI